MDEGKGCTGAGDNISRMAEHYENFPVASWLCPPLLRPPISAIYRFARTADDIADEGHASPADRLKDLGAMRADLLAVAAGRQHSGHWPEVFETLESMLVRWGLPVPLLADLLDAFEQDVIKTRDASGYHDIAELLDYCRRSANPVGRLLLHLYGMDDDESLQQSDAVCSALQLINFWQDLSVDLPRGRLYLPHQVCQAHGLNTQSLQVGIDTPQTRAIVAELVKHARDLMLHGAPLALRVPGRTGWELRLVVQGGLRILDKIESLGFATLSQRPTIRKADTLLMLWRAVRMRP